MMEATARSAIRRLVTGPSFVSSWRIADAAVSHLSRGCAFLDLQDAPNVWTVGPGAEHCSTRSSRAE